MKLGILIIDTTVMVLLIIFTYNVTYESASENLAYTVTTITIHRFNCQVLNVYSCTAVTVHVLCCTYIMCTGQLAASHMYWITVIP